MNRLFLGFAVLLFFAVVLVIEAGYVWWNSHHGAGVKRLDQDAAAPACQSGKHERSRILHAHQSGLDRDASG